MMRGLLQLQGPLPTAVARAAGAFRTWCSLSATRPAWDFYQVRAISLDASQVGWQTNSEIVATLGRHHDPVSTRAKHLVDVRPISDGKSRNPDLPASCAATAGMRCAETVEMNPLLDLL